MKEVAKIYEHHNYETFKRMKSNRNIDDCRKKKVRKSIEKIGYIVGAPIIVNENMEIIDGQCRFDICKELGLPIYFTIQKDAGIDECISMNVSSTPWKMMDYIRSYAESGNENYVYLNTQIESKKSLRPSVVAAICSDLTGKADMCAINSGRFVVDWGKIDEIENTLNFLDEVMPIIKKMDGDTTKMCSALVFAYRHSSADITRLRKIVGDMVLTSQIEQTGVSTLKHALKMIENAYNNRLAARNRIRLTDEYEDYMIGKFDWYEKKWGRRYS